MQDRPRRLAYNFRAQIRSGRDVKVVQVAADEKSQENSVIRTERKPE